MNNRPWDKMLSLRIPRAARNRYRALDSICGKNDEIFLNLEAVRHGWKVVWSCCDVRCASAEVLRRRVSHFKAIRQFCPPISRLQDFMRSYDETSSRLVKRLLGELGGSLFVPGAMPWVVCSPSSIICVNSHPVFCRYEYKHVATQFVHDRSVPESEISYHGTWYMYLSVGDMTKLTTTNMHIITLIAWYEALLRRFDRMNGKWSLTMKNWDNNADIERTKFITMTS